MTRGSVVSANTSWEYKNTPSSLTLFLQLGCNHQIYYSGLFLVLRIFRCKFGTDETNIIQRVSWTRLWWGCSTSVEVSMHISETTQNIFFCGKGYSDTRKLHATKSWKRHAAPERGSFQASFLGGKLPVHDSSFPASENSQTAISQSHLLSGSLRCHRRSP